MDFLATGGDIKRLRKQKGWIQQILAEHVGVTKTTIVDWERGRYFPEGENLKNLAKALDVSVAYLLGETDNPSPPGAREAAPLHETGGQSSPPLPGNFAEIPLLEMPPASTPGALQKKVNKADDSTEKTIVSRDTLRIDNMKKPFGIRVSGNSMERAGISAGAIAIVNPAEEFSNGSAYLIYYNGEWFIRWIFIHPDGRVELHAASDKPTISVDAETANDKMLFSIVGKIVEVLRSNKPANMF